VIADAARRIRCVIKHQRLLSSVERSVFMMNQHGSNKYSKEDRVCVCVCVYVSMIMPSRCDVVAAVSVLQRPVRAFQESARAAGSDAVPR
jgi:hypothetical protein